MARFRREKHFTREKQLSFAWGSVEPRDLTEVGGTAAPQGYILLHDLHEQSSPSGGGNSCGPAQRRAAARWEFPAKPVRMAAGHRARPPTPHRLKCSERKRIPENLCRCGHGSGQTGGSVAAVASTHDAQARSDDSNEWPPFTGFSQVVAP